MDGNFLLYFHQNLMNMMAITFQLRKPFGEIHVSWRQTWWFGWLSTGQARGDDGERLNQSSVVFLTWSTITAYFDTFRDSVVVHFTVPNRRTHTWALPSFFVFTLKKSCLDTSLLPCTELNSRSIHKCRDSTHTQGTKQALNESKKN